MIARHAERADARGRARGLQQGIAASLAVARAVVETRIDGAVITNNCTIAYGRETPYLQGFLAMPPLPDDVYDVIVVDAEVDDDGELRLEVAVTLGPHIGRIVALRKLHVESRSRRARHHRSVSRCSESPGTLRVRDGVPSFRPETV